MYVVEVENVSRSTPNVIPLFPLTRHAVMSNGSPIGCVTARSLQ
jgi:hypothetical protein